MIPLPVGLIGAGYIARRHLADLMSFDDVRVVGVADVDRERAEELAVACGARAYGDHHELLAGERLEAVYVCVPPFAHGDVERHAIELGLPLFIEKPLARDLDTADEIAVAIAAAGLVTATGYHWRYLDIVEEAADLLTAKPAHLALGYWLDELPPPAWWGRESQCGGQMVEQTTHIFDLARLLVGEIASVRAEASRVPLSRRPDCDISSVSTASIRFRSGALGSIVSTCLLPRAHRIGLHLFGDGLILELSEVELLIDTGDGLRVRRAVDDPFLREDRDFIDAVKGGPDRIRAPYAEALATHRLATAAARAARDGSMVELEGSGDG